MSDIKLIVFDWDGTLSDSADRIVAALRQGAGEVGLPDRSDQEIRDIIGLGLNESFKTLYPEIEEARLEPFSDAYRNAYLNTDRTAVLFDGVIDTLNLLHDQYTLAVATGKTRLGLDRELEETQLGPYFVATRCADETAPKPNPQMLLEIFEHTGIGPNETLMIGDTDHDIGTAKNAGCLALAVSCGAQLLERLESAEPAVILNTVNELPAWLAR